MIEDERKFTEDIVLSGSIQGPAVTRIFEPRIYHKIYDKEENRCKEELRKKEAKKLRASKRSRKINRHK